MFSNNQTQQNMTKSSNLLQNPLETLLVPYADTQEPHLHLKIFKNGVNIPNCSIGCLTPKEIN